jgi:hypothetical protein
MSLFGASVKDVRAAECPLFGPLLNFNLSHAAEARARFHGIMPRFHAQRRLGSDTKRRAIRTQSDQAIALLGFVVVTSVPPWPSLLRLKSAADAYVPSNAISAVSFGLPSLTVKVPGPLLPLNANVV